MNLKLDDDVLGCRAGQVVDLYERIEVVNCRKVLPSIQFKEISPNFHPWALATAVLSQRFFWLWGFICWHASQCSASALCLNLGRTCPYNSSRARLNMLSWPRWAECSLFSISLLRVKWIGFSPPLGWFRLDDSACHGCQSTDGWVQERHFSWLAILRQWLVGMSVGHDLRCFRDFLCYFVWDV